MDEKKLWTPDDELEGVEELLQTGAVPEETAFSLDDILREFGENADELNLDPQQEVVLQEEHVEVAAAEPEPAAPETTPPTEPDDQTAEPPAEEIPSQESTPGEPEPPTTPTPVNLSDTADFISQQVSQVMGPEEEPDDSTSLKALFEDARRKAALKKKEKQTKQTKQHASEAALNAALEAEKSSPVLEMPVSRLKPLRDKVGRLQDKANDFADNMWSQSGPPSEEEQIKERYIPGTDEETVPKKRRRVRKPLIPLKTFPDVPSDVLTQRYRTGLRFMGQRVWYLLFLTLVLLYLNLAPSCQLPLPAVLASNARLMAGILTWTLGLCATIGLDVIWLGLTAPFRGRPGMHTLTACAVIATLLDGTFYAAIGRKGPLPFAAMAAFLLTCALWGAYDRKRALHMACRSVAVSSEPYRVTLDDDKWDGTGAFNKETGTEEGFGRQLQSLDGAERLYRFCVPVLLVAGLLFALVASVGQGKPELFLWCLSSILVAGAPASGLLAFGQPYLRLTRRLDRSGAVLAGWDGVESMAGKANILLKDEDLFPPGSIFLTSTKSFDNVSIEKMAGCTASMLRQAGSGLYHLFDDEIRRQGGFYRRVDDLSCYEAGGLTANIRGESIMIGTAGFMAVMRVPIDQGLGIKSGVFFVINNRLAGIFKLKYELSHYAKSSVDALLRANVRPVLVTRDFNVNPEMLRVKMDLPAADQMEYPPISRRQELSEPNQPHNPVIGALLTREGLGAYSDAIIGGRRLRSVVRLNALLAILSSVVGMLLTFYLTATLAFTSLTPLNLTVFLLLWLVPTLAISGAVDKF